MLILSSVAYNCINSLWFYRWNVVIAVLLVVVGPDRSVDGRFLFAARECRLAANSVQWCVGTH
jgi:hypothetical protein